MDCQVSASALVLSFNSTVDSSGSANSFDSANPENQCHTRHERQHPDRPEDGLIPEAIDDLSYGIGEARPAKARRHECGAHGSTHGLRRKDVGMQREDV